MKNTSDRSSQWIFFLIAGLYLGTVFLRSILIYQGKLELPRILGILILWSVLCFSERLVSAKWSGYFPFYLALQTGMVYILLGAPGHPDFLSNLYPILSMQVVLRLKLRFWIAWTGLCALATTMLLLGTYEKETFALVLIYTAGSIFYGLIARATQKADVAREKNLDLAQELQEANQKLRSYSTQLEGLVVARERNRLARDLHDSVTQTVFSMTLTIQSAMLLLERDPSKVEVQLDRLSQLAQNALSEMQLLISELKPEETNPQGLASSIRSFLRDGHIPENISVELDAHGEKVLKPAEEQSLFHIVQEALNNIVKHAQADKVRIQLHMTEPMWIEVEDKGCGFDLQHVQNNGRVGLFSMRERAEEIGWNFNIKTSPGSGTCIRVEKLPGKARQE